MHLKVPNHGRVFHALLSAYFPNWREREASRLGRVKSRAPPPSTAP
ncbi:MAG: hypothetical protein ACREEB_00080 [Caulobacteraceae bacterium]